MDVSRSRLPIDLRKLWLSMDMRRFRLSWTGGSYGFP